METEEHSTERRAEFLLFNAVDEQDHTQAKDEARKLGLDPEQIEGDRAFRRARFAENLARVRERFSDLSPEEVEELVDEAVREVRRQKREAKDQGKQGSD